MRRLGAREVPVVRFNTDRYPFNAFITCRIDDSATLTAFCTEGGLALTTAPRALWYRRAWSPPRDETMTAPVYDFCVREARSVLQGSALASTAPTMSPPDCIWAAEHKLYQLIQAQKCGLPIPRTVVTNEPAAILEAYRTFEQRMIVKPVRLGYIEDAPQPRAIYTSQVLAEHLDSIADAQLAPSIYQELIPKQCDVRVTIVGRRVFVADIWSQEDPAAAIDWRRTVDPNLRHTKGQLPESLSGCLLDLMSRLGLHFAAIDLIKLDDGDYTFLEINPNGQWLWLDDRLGCDITGTIAAWLAAAGDLTC